MASIVAADIVFYAAGTGSPPGPTDDTSTSGGAINTSYRVVFTDVASAVKVEAASSLSTDGARTITFSGRNASGTVVTDSAKTISATANTYTAISDTTFERLESVTLDAAANGVIRVRVSVAGALVSDIPAGEKGFIRLFRQATIPASSSTTRYEKLFVKNTNATNDLVTCDIAQSADNTGGKVTWALETSVNNTQSVANRTTLPTISGSFGTATVLLSTAVSGHPNLLASEAEGVWFRMINTSGDSPLKNTYVLQVDGSTT